MLDLILVKHTNNDSKCFCQVLFHTSHTKALLSGLYGVGGAKAR